jgi:sugar phosphate isomerase/epimerase
MNPKISIGSWAFAFGPFVNNPWPFSKILKYASEAGYDGVEINGFLPHPVPELYDTTAKRKELLNEIESFGLGISGYAPDFTKVPPAIVESKQYLELLLKYIEFCQDLNIKTIRVDTISPPESLSISEYNKRFDQLFTTWRQSAELVKQNGMNIVWEFEPGFWLNKPSEVKRLVESVNHPAFQILFDTSHAYMSGVIGARQSGEKEQLAGGIIEYANLLKDHIGHFHLIDSDGTLHDNETSTHAEFGRGMIDFTSFLSEMKPTLSSLEWWCVDFCFNAEVEAWGKEAIPFIKERVKEVLI